MFVFGFFLNGLSIPEEIDSFVFLIFACFISSALTFIFLFLSSREIRLHILFYITWVSSTFVVYLLCFYFFIFDTFFKNFNSYYKDFGVGYFFLMIFLPIWMTCLPLFFGKLLAVKDKINYIKNKVLWLGCIFVPHGISIIYYLGWNLFDRFIVTNIFLFLILFFIIVLSVARLTGFRVFGKFYLFFCLNIFLFYLSGLYVFIYGK